MCMTLRQLDTEIEDVAQESGDGETGHTLDRVAASSIERSGLLATLDDIASDMTVSSFKCAACGLSHGHDTNKHRAGDSFEASGKDLAEGMEFNPNCHCGAHELAARGSEFGVDEVAAQDTAGRAPVSDDVKRAVNRL